MVFGGAGSNNKTFPLKTLMKLFFRRVMKTVIGMSSYFGLRQTAGVEASGL